MSVETGAIAIAVLLVLLAIRVPIAIALLLTAFGGLWSMLGVQAAIGLVASTPYNFMANWTLSAVPMFLLMGFIAYHAGLTTSLFRAAKVILRNVPGGLAMSTIFACSGFAAICGSSIACAAAMGRIAIPEMTANGYRRSFACGTVAAGGTLGALIPPSILLIVYGVFAQTSITQLFLGGISVGILTAISYCTLILIISLVRSDISPRHLAITDDQTSLRSLLEIWPIMALALIVFGGLFSGFFSATESGAIGAIGAIVISLVSGRLTWRTILRSFTETLSTSAALFIIGVGASVFTKFLGLSGLSTWIAGQVTGMELTQLQLIIAIVMIYIVLGMFMEPFGAMLVTLPVFLPILVSMDVSPLWFGILVVKMLELGMVTPPVGMNVFIVKSVAGADTTLSEVFRGVSIFLVADLLVIAAIIAFPVVVLFLPSL